MNLFGGDWKITVGWTMIGSLLAGVVLVSSAITAIPVIEPWAPATRSYVRDQIQIVQGDVLDQVHVVTLADNAYQAKIDAGLRDNTVGILDLKLVAIDGQLDSLNNQLNMIVLKLADPQGADRDLLSGLKDTLTRQIAEKQQERQLAACQKMLAEFPGTTCPTPN